ncbi:hypothetical protein H5410_053885 [Solanum commersonii]|uniref:Uncharacterized protein n=1 Tax=Solanum commersonii TaxID=4109 RepID=A0A9J5X5U3_SOLCO|nr:hypothetical protein H5410_053885 [Solanum commersonii]
MTPMEVYPISALGGVGYISALKEPFSHIPMCQFFIRGSLARKHLIGQYIGQGAASASAVVLSDAVFDIEAMSQWNFYKIY